jgi:uncharacterized protein
MFPFISRRRRRVVPILGYSHTHTSRSYYNNNNNIYMDHQSTKKSRPIWRSASTRTLSSHDQQQHYDDDDDDDPHRQRILSSSSSSKQDDDYEIVKDTLDWLQHVVMGLGLCPFAKPSFVSDEIRIVVVHGENPTDILASVLHECWKLRRTTLPAPESQGGDNKRRDGELSLSTGGGGGGGTTLVVCPDLYPDDFEEYLAIHTVLEEGILVDQELTGELQVAPFHPLFEFASEEERDFQDGCNTDHHHPLDNHPEENNERRPVAAVAIENYTNRSPYPIFHILREEEVSKAVESLEGDASRVWQRNVDLLKDLEAEFDCTAAAVEDNGQDLLRSVVLRGKGRHDLKHSAMWERVDNILKQFKRKRAGT